MKETFKVIGIICFAIIVLAILIVFSTSLVIGVNEITLGLSEINEHLSNGFKLACIALGSWWLFNGICDFFNKITGK